MRIMFEVNTQWEKGSIIQETDTVNFLDDDYKIRFVATNGKMAILYQIYIQDENEYKRIKQELFTNGNYDFSNYLVEMGLDGNKWIKLKKEEENGHSK